MLKSTLTAVLAMCVVALLVAAPAFAVSVLTEPPPPASFSGTVQVNGENLPDGTLIIAMINGEAYAATYLQTSLGNSVYSLDVPGDDPSTVECEGARDGDVVQFELGSVLADQAGTWHSGASVQLNLTLLASGVPPTLMPTLSPDQAPTQTQVPVVQASATPTQTPTPSQISQPISPAPATPTPVPTSSSQPSPTPSQTSGPTLQTSPTPTLTPSSPSFLVSVWTATPTASASPVDARLTTLTPISTPTRQPTPARTPAPPGQPTPAITPSATAVQTVNPVAQLAATKAPLPTATRTADPPVQPKIKPVAPLSSKEGDPGDPIEGVLLIAAAVAVVLVTFGVIAAGTIVWYIRQPK